MKALALIDQQEEVLINACRRIQDRQKMFQQEMEFMKRNMENAAKKYDVQNQEDWLEIEAYLKSKGILKDYDKEKNHLSFSFESNLISINENKENDEMINLLKTYLGGLLK